MFSQVGHWLYWFWSFLKDSGGGQCQTLPVNGPGKPVWSYKWSTVCAASAEPGYMREGQSSIPWPTFTSTGPRGRSTKIPRHPNIHLHLPGGCLLGSVTERAFGRIQVIWGKFPVSQSPGRSEGVHKADTGSNLGPVLGLRPLSKCPKINQV